MHLDIDLHTPIGWWFDPQQTPQTGSQALRASLHDVRSPLYLVNFDGRPAVVRNGTATLSPEADRRRPEKTLPLLAAVPPLHPRNLGSPHFRRAVGVHYPYVVGAMANGITSVAMVEAAARAGLLAFFGAAGLVPSEIEAAVRNLQQRLDHLPFGSNLIHSPNEPELEKATVELYLNLGLRLVSASAYLDLTPPLVHYRVKGIHRDAEGRIVCPNRVVAKVSRIEVARKFFAPPPEKILRHLQDTRQITAAEADLARRIPLADMLTAEADSGGHTDNQPAIALLPTMLALRDRMVARHGYDRPLCVGLAGGIATPESTAAAFALGADYVLTGSVNQACLEAGTSAAVRAMLAEACQADVTMAPAADMFEMGVKVQVLKRGTMFAFRAARLYDLYSRYGCLADIPEKDIQFLERDLFRRSISEEWEATRVFFLQRDPRQIELAGSDPKHKMALVFRSYLGRSSTWANMGESSRKIDYQVWCGPSMGAFNEWARDSFLQAPDHRTTETVALNLLLGAAVNTRNHWLRSQGVDLPVSTAAFRPLPLPEIRKLLDGSFAERTG